MAQEGGQVIGRRRADGQANKKLETCAITNAITHKRCTYMLKCDGLYFSKSFPPRRNLSIVLSSQSLRQSSVAAGVLKQETKLTGVLVMYKMFKHF